MSRIFSIASIMLAFCVACGSSVSDSSAESELVSQGSGSAVSRAAVSDEDKPLGWLGSAKAAPQDSAAEPENSTGPENSTEPGGPIADLIKPLDPADGVPEVVDYPTPVAFSFDQIGVDNAVVRGVGIEANGELEVPEASEIGWYQFGSSPGQPGSAVLAAHIAYSGEDGAFRYLSNSEVGDEFSVTFDDGTTSRYRVNERSQYDKDELPFDRVFAKDGPPEIALVTCGGTFQPSVASYQDNVVAYAAPIG